MTLSTDTAEATVVRVLLIEDDPTVASFVKRAMQRASGLQAEVVHAPRLSS